MNRSSPCLRGGRRLLWFDVHAPARSTSALMPCPTLFPGLSVAILRSKRGSQCPLASSLARGSARACCGGRVSRLACWTSRPGRDWCAPAESTRPKTCQSRDAIAHTCEPMTSLRSWRTAPAQRIQVPRLGTALGCYHVQPHATGTQQAEPATTHVSSFRSLFVLCATRSSDSLSPEILGKRPRCNCFAGASSSNRSLHVTFSLGG